MSKIRRIWNVFLSLLMIIAALLIAFTGKGGYMVAAAALGIILFIAAIRQLLYYLTMSRHMVGGRITLLKGIIMLDFALLMMSVQDVPPIYVMLYMMGSMIFANVINILQALEAKRLGAKHWKFKTVSNIIGILAAMFCLAHYKQVDFVSAIFGAELAYLAVVRIINSFRRTAIIHIQ